jgi:predicted nucleotidyltransferase component of viral defense system
VALITRGAITRIADHDGVSAPVVERDYVLTRVVDSLAQLDPPAGLVFKGGTALRLCFCEDFRYSAASSFSIAGRRVSDALALLRQRSIAAQTRSRYHGSTFLKPTLA